MRWQLVLVVMAMLLSACTVPVGERADSANSGNPGGGVASGDTSMPATATPEARPEPTPIPAPTAKPQPTSTPEPTATPDTTPVVLQGESWAITEADTSRLADFVEQVHELAFTSTVEVRSDDDIGANYIRGLESFTVDDWQLLTALDLIEPSIDRETVNQLRLDRVRGLCCRGNGSALVVIVEPRSTKLETELIVVHELVHALHAQHRDLRGQAPRSAGFELPDPTAGIIEGIAQFVAFEYLALQPAAARTRVEPDLTIVDDELAEKSGAVPAAMLNFSYFTAPDLASAAYQARGAQGLSDLLANPPSTTEQLAYPDTWLSGEDRVSQDPPPIPPQARWLDEGRLGVAMLGWILMPVADDATLSELLQQWAGDRWSLYEHDGESCVSATIEMDEPSAAAFVATLIEDRYGRSTSAPSPSHVQFDTCLAR